MNNINPLGKTYKEYQEELEKVNLTKLEKINLNVVQEIQGMLSDGERGLQEANRIGGNIQGLVNDIDKAVDSIDSMEVQLSNISNPINILGKAIQDFEFTKRNLEQQVKDLGISIKDIKGYSEAEKQNKVWVKEKKWLEGREEAGKNALKKIR